MLDLLSNELCTPLGKIYLNKEVIAIIAGLAAVECYGLVGMVPRKIKDEIGQILKRENLSRGVEIFVDRDRLIIDLYIIVIYGIRIPEVSLNIIEKVKYAVEKYTGLEVSQININVQGVRIGR